MSGHSKWSKIKRAKMANDVNRSHIFSKLSHIITLAVVEGGRITDPQNNVKLRLAIEKARSLNMPKDNILRAIEHGVSPGKSNLKEVVYEGFGPYGIAIVIVATTDNANRTLSEVRNTLELNGGKLATQHAVTYLFEKCGVLTIEKDQASEEAVFEFAQKINAFDIEQNETYLVYFPFENIGKINAQVETLKITSTDIIYKPKITIALANEEEKNQVISLVNSLESLSDVQKVFVNTKII